MSISKFFALYIIAGLILTMTSPVAKAEVATERSRVVNNEAKMGQVGVGVQVGAISGITVEYWNTPTTTVDLSWIAGQSSWGLGLTHNWMFRRDSSAFAPYVGAGLLAGFGRHWEYIGRYEDTTFLALQAPLGIAFLPHAQRFSIYAEVAPSLQMTPYSIGFLSSAVGARFYF